MKNRLIISFLICLTASLTYAQDGQNKESISGKTSFSLEPLWSTQIDPRWKAGEVIGNVEDGITVEFVEFSADGSLLVTGNGQGEAFVLDATNGSVRHTFTYITEEEVRHLDRNLVTNISGGYTKSLEVECGAFTPDGTGVGTGTACVRAEREGTGNGRVYEISYTATDPAGAECFGSVTVCVPHDQGPEHECIDDGQNYDSTEE